MFLSLNKGRTFKRYVVKMPHLLVRVIHCENTGSGLIGDRER